ncbi:MAG: metallophosphoesterase [Dehalococcoidia bacterium]
MKGDWGAGSSAQAAITTRMCDWRAATGFTDVLTTGGNFYDPDGIATNVNYYGPERCLYGHHRHKWRAAWGNHDYSGSSTHDVLGSPSQPKYFSWGVGDVAFFVYDGTDVTQAQRDWLRSAVCSSDVAIEVIYGHQPPYSTGPHGSDLAVRHMVDPVARDCGPRLVLSGHDHLYERSFPIEDVPYIVTGGAGASTYTCGGPQPWVATCVSRHHFLYMEVSDAEIRVRAVGTDGRIFDVVNIGPQRDPPAS